MSNINTNKYLNIKLSNILSNEIETYIGNCIDTGNLDYNEKINIEDEDTDEVIDDLRFKMFNDYITGFNFAEHSNNTELVKRITTLIQYCNEFYEEHYGEESIINWRDFDDYDKIINHAGYVFVNDNTDWFVNTWNKLVGGESNCLK
jgi:hypothetical protein